MDIDMKFKKEDKQQYDKLTRMVNKAEKKAIEFIKNNLSHDSDLQLKCISCRKITV